ncbi:MAG: TetR/AcrR family transcriptional regulator [candidate division KSB1 bacterium]|nr:TetR/AcrR family transcriptional regulator [candidate division KSB1 bacterium]
MRDSETASQSGIREDRRKSILEAAIRLFAEKGYHETRMDDVAEAAGLSKGALYLYYKSKEDLFCALIEEKVQELIPTLQSAVDGAHSLPDLVHKVVRTQLSLRQDNVHMFRIFQAHQWRSDLRMERSMEHIRRHLEQFVVTLANAFARFLSELSSEECRSLALELFGMLNMHTVDWLVRGDSRPLVARAETIARHFLYGVEALQGD